MIKVYGMSICPDCVDAINKLEEAKVEYEFLDFCKETKNLKEFLKFRDNLPIFDMPKQMGGIGIPCFVTDSTITFDIEKVL